MDPSRELALSLAHVIHVKSAIASVTLQHAQEVGAVSRRSKRHLDRCNKMVARRLLLNAGRNEKSRGESQRAGTKCGPQKHPTQSHGEGPSSTVADHLGGPLSARCPPAADARSLHVKGIETASAFRPAAMPAIDPELRLPFQVLTNCPPIPA